jgi:hypothetical protein
LVLEAHNRRSILVLEGERKLSSFGEDLSAVMEQDMEEWAKQNTVEQTAQDESEQIRMGVSSSSQPPVTIREQKVQLVKSYVLLPKYLDFG